VTQKRQTAATHVSSQLNLTVSRFPKVAFSENSSFETLSVNTTANSSLHKIFQPPEPS
jgi:hypothetical protein